LKQPKLRVVLQTTPAAAPVLIANATITSAAGNRHGIAARWSKRVTVIIRLPCPALPLLRQLSLSVALVPRGLLVRRVPVLRVLRLLLCGQ